MLTSDKITTAIDSIVGKELFLHGFEYHRGRKYVGWHGHAVWCLEFRAFV